MKKMTTLLDLRIAYRMYTTIYTLQRTYTVIKTKHHEGFSLVLDPPSGRPIPTQYYHACNQTRSSYISLFFNQKAYHFIFLKFQ